MNEADVFASSGLPPREQVSQWASVKGVIGDKIMGVYQGWWISPASNAGFKDQIGVALKITNTAQVVKDNKGVTLTLKEGEIIGISLGDTSFTRERVSPSQVGDEVGIKYEGDKDTGKPQKAKIVKFYNPAMEKRREDGTIKQTTPEVLATKNTAEDDLEEAF